MKPRKLLFWCHLIAGCTAGIVILIMSISGVLLAFERQIIAWSGERYKVAPRPAGSQSPSIEMIEKLVDVSTPPSPSITIRASATAPVELSFGRDRTVFVDPTTGKMLTQQSKGIRVFFATVERIHRALGGELRQSLGRNITGVCNLLFFFLVVSGFYLWFPKKYSRQYFRPGLWFEKGLKARARYLNWHKVIGFWSAIPLFIIVLTGIIMSYSWATNLLYRVTGTQPPPQQAELRNAGAQDRSARGAHKESRSRHRNSSPDVKSLDVLLAVVERTVPGWKSITFRLPARGDESITFSVDEGTGGQPQKRHQFTLSRTSGEVKREEGFATYNLGRKLRTIARFLHTGEILGIGGQIIAAIASFGASLLVFTGLALAIRRLVGLYRRKAAANRIVKNSGELQTSNR